MPRAPVFRRWTGTTWGAASFAATPDAFPDLMAAAIERRDIGQWTSERGLVTASPDKSN